ncbi:uncharacterized protein LOC123013164 isoform X3 [Tribolium madens]|nr:uncharacterized protein LOC123013164 isoform X3 [Tribolium madens]XP_044267480.1 uncharacterized protein LOC123013164 isoform X3 [Tribolium madens]XP_044267481.1 uncharacterized protein LOC123013164 isoform X3 [Tribolium madens]XP_044267482.1 uncharacterized protein LOC123013164 isoform X3 [Tribolium madens]
MKCTAIKLSSREEQTRVKKWKENNTLVFTGEEGHSYSFPFFKQKGSKSNTLAINNLNLPANIQSFNTGSSLDKWSKKRPRLKSAKISKSPTEDDRDFCYDTLETDLSLLLNDSDDPPKSPDDSLKNLQYEVHSDIEKLLQESQRSAQEEKEDKTKKRRKKRGKKTKDKVIKFSKPPSPQTEQVIRVDVTSSVCNEEKYLGVKKMEENNNKDEIVDQMIDDKRKELKRNLEKNSEEMCDEDFIVRCKQLALRQRRRRL